MTYYLSALLFFCSAFSKKTSLASDPEQEDLKRATVLDCDYFSKNIDIVLSDDPESPEDKVIINGEQNLPAQWDNIYIQSSNTVNEIGYAEIRNGGKANDYPNGAVLVDQSEYLNIHDVAFIKCFEYGISLNLASSSTSLRIAYTNLSLDNTPKLFFNWSGSEESNPYNP